MAVCLSGGDRDSAFCGQKCVVGFRENVDVDNTFGSRFSKILKISALYIIYTVYIGGGLTTVLYSFILVLGIREALVQAGCGI